MPIGALFLLQKKRDHIVTFFHLLPRARLYAELHEQIIIPSSISHNLALGVFFTTQLGDMRIEIYAHLHIFTSKSGGKCGGLAKIALALRFLPLSSFLRAFRQA